MKTGAGHTLAVLRHRHEFLAIAASGRKWVTPGLILQIGPAPEATHPLRYGLTASSKIGNAVIRNRTRRRLRALAAEMLPYHAALAWDYVLIARATTPKRRYADLKEDLTNALKKLGAWRDK